MKKGLTEIVAIIDRSGSMIDSKEATIECFNSFFEEQKKIKGKANLTVVLFDGNYGSFDGNYIEFICDNEKLENFPGLTEENYNPSGMTAMNDAIGSTIDTVGKRLANMEESERPEKVIVSIITDGQENVSKEYTGKQVADMIKKQEKEFSWEFLFLGADVDVDSIADTLNIKQNNRFVFNKSVHGMKKMSNTLSATYTSYRS